jgi:hypothetical protein
MLLSKLTPDAAKPSAHLKELLPMGPVQPLMVDRLASAWFHTLSALHAKPRYSLDGSTPWVAPSLPAVGYCASVWSYYWYVCRETRIVTYPTKGCTLDV